MRWLHFQHYRLTRARLMELWGARIEEKIKVITTSYNQVSQLQNNTRILKTTRLTLAHTHRCSSLRREKGGNTYIRIKRPCTETKGHAPKGDYSNTDYAGLDSGLYSLLYLRKN